ncbi:MAG: GTP-binding protein [Planctomycetes bacterium]|nr:GTP-binding protein [Planctomycetota bacterium]
MIPLHILTGFLGSGKTTLLSRLLQDPGPERIAVLVNEAGEIALDQHLVEAIDEDIVALSSGCACCTVRGELHAALERVLALEPARIVLETTGLADPAPILHGLSSDPRLARRLRVASVIAVADASRIDELLETQPEVRRQLAFADRIVLTHGDVSPQRLARARELLGREAPGAELREAESGRIERAWLLAEEPLGAVRDASDARVWLHHGHGQASFRTHSVEVAEPARIEPAELWMRLVCGIDGPRVLRIKALVECRDSGGVFVLQSAQHAVAPPRRLARPPAGFHGAQVVVIERGLDERSRAALLDSLRSALRA